jgi:thiamine-monophosphate kinase
MLHSKRILKNMQQLKDIIENKIINDLTKSFRLSPSQLNKIHETDAEVIRLENSAYDLAITIDTISEEIKTGLYSDPYLIGWMSVIVNMSDLAAVGANPIGIVISQIFPKDVSTEFLDKIQAGINDACLKCGTFVLGGDTNFGDQLIISGCAIGTLEKGKHLKRIGCKPGDRIYLTGKVGYGNAYAFQKLFNKNDYKINYQPSAKLEWVKILKKHSSSCIDTSDGVISSLDQIMKLNNMGFKFRNDWDEVIDLSSTQLFGNHNLPLWFLLAAEHGEFELLFTVPAEKKLEFLKETCHLNLKPLYLGETMEDQKITINIYDREQSLDTEKIRNLAFEKEFSPTKYLQNLLKMDALFKRT